MVRSPPGRGQNGPVRLAGLAVALAILVTVAGCAGIGDANTQPSLTPETSAPPTTEPPDTDSPDSSTEEPTTASPSVSSGDLGRTGLMTVVVAGEELPLEVSGGGLPFQFNGTEPHTWHAGSGVTLAESLSTLGVEVTAETLAYEGTTYDDRNNGTTVSVRVNGDPVEPANYTLSDGDEVWVTVETADMIVSTPGDYIRQADQHIHGHLEFSVEGEQIDFGKERYQSNDRYFHFEAGDGRSWHAHSYTITLEYALSSLDGINVSADGETVTVDGTTYDVDDPDTTIRIEVNGEPVDPGGYYLKDWDGVRVVIETEG